MRKARAVARVIIVIGAIIAITVAGVLLFFKLYGKNIVESALSKALGVKVRFEGLSVNLADYTVNFKGMKIPAKPGFREKTAFGAEKFSITLDREQFNKNRKIVFEKIFIERGTLHIERNQRGTFNISNTNSPPGGEGVAYADVSVPTPGIPAPKPTALYDFAKGVKNLVIRDSVVEFKDSYLYGVPYTITGDNVNLSVTSESMPGFMSVNGTLSFTVPNNRYGADGRVFISGTSAVYEYMANMDITMETNNIDLMQFQPYFEKYTPFYFTEGLFSSNTKFEIHDNSIRSLTTMVFHRLSLGVKPGMQNTVFLKTSVNRLIPYLTTGSGGVVFDFTLSGPISDPQGGLGPQVRKAIGMVVTEEALKILQQLQQR